MIRRTGILAKKGNCVDCGKDTYLTAGRCQFHYKQHRTNELRLRNAARGIQPKQNKKKMTKEKKPALSSFFQYAINLVARRPYCSECGALIEPAYYHAAVAHILPKAIFESVAAHEDNFIILGAQCGCHNKTHTLTLFFQMKVWSLAVKRFLRFRDQIEEKHKLLNQFEELAEPLINAYTNQ